MAKLADRHVLVVGASSGIGRATVLHLAQAGSRVVAAARRADRLQELEREAPGVVSVAFDAADPDACRRGVARSIEALSGLDALVYAAGLVVVGEIGALDPEQWRRSLDVNLMGAIWCLRAATPALRERRGRALLLSSRVASDDPPRRGMGPYIVSKAALDKLAAVWQEECPEVAITRVSVGDTGATEMATHWNPDAGQRYVQEWIARGHLVGRAMQPEDVARHLARLLESDDAIPFSAIYPRPPEAVGDTADGV